MRRRWCHVIREMASCSLLTLSGGEGCVMLMLLEERWSHAPAVSRKRWCNAPVVSRKMVSCSCCEEDTLVSCSCCQGEKVM